MDKNILIKQLSSLLSDENDFFANASNFSSLIYHDFEKLNWVGFYLFRKETLVLGPFQGKTACIRIEPGKGVCGTAFRKNETVIVDNVHEFPGHIPCDDASNSEIVIPMVYENKVIGVLDIDSPVYNRFSEEDKLTFEEMLKILIRSSDMEKMIYYYNN